MIEAATGDLGITVISDEIYHRLAYAAPDTSAHCPTADDVTVINSFSKYYCMTGWRIGWMVLPGDARAGLIERLAQSLYISAPETVAGWRRSALSTRRAELDQGQAALHGVNRSLLLRRRCRKSACRWQHRWMERSTPIATSRGIPMTAWISRSKLAEAECHVAATPGARFRHEPKGIASCGCPMPGAKPRCREGHRAACAPGSDHISGCRKPAQAPVFLKCVLQTSRIEETQKKLFRCHQPRLARLGVVIPCRAPTT
jgi:hypothetical protein